MFFAGLTEELFAVDTSQIDLVRRKEVLEPADLEIIDGFVSQVVQEILRTTDLTSISDTRNVLLTRRTSIAQSSEGQYKQQLFTSAAKYLKEAFDNAGQLTPVELKDKIRLSLIILLDNLQDLRPAELAAQMLDDENTAVRYWAVHAVTDPAIVKELNTAGRTHAELIQTIAEKLKARTDSEASPEIMSMIVDFAGGLAGSEAGNLLLHIADLRIKMYENWTADYELLDEKVLRFLCDNITGTGSTKESKDNFSRRFTQLYSYAMQRYIKASKEGTLLSAVQKQQLASTLTDAEQKCIGKLLGMAQSVVKTAIEKDSYSSLSAEYDSLFGSEGKTGRLQQSLNLDYIPPALPDPPAKATE